MKKSEVLLKTASIYLIYFIYTYFASYICGMFSDINNQVVRLFLDILFLIFIVFFYKEDLKKDVSVIQKEYGFKKILKVIFVGFLSIILMNFLISLGMGLFFPDVTLDQNTQSIQNMASLSIIYTIFKTMIFGVIAEEILFRKSLSNCIENNIMFILISAIIYTAMNFIFTTSEISIAQLFVYFLPAVVFSTIYIKNDRNIILVMLVKFVYNLIPLTILLLGV